MKTRSMRHGNVEDVLDYDQVDEDAQEVDAKLKTQQLRIAGQAQTIKALETQLGEALETPRRAHSSAESRRLKGEGHAQRAAARDAAG